MPSGVYPGNGKQGFKKGHPKYPGSGAPKGSHNSPATQFKKGQFKDEKHPQWKGDEVSYVGLHMWIRRKLGKPNKCEHCKTEEERLYHWANISKEYKRELSDWIRLCVPCHKRYDLNRK